MIRTVVAGAAIALTLAACSSAESAPTDSSVPPSSTTATVATTTIPAPPTSTSLPATTTTEASDAPFVWPCRTWPCEDSVRQERWPQAPDIWHPDFSPYITVEPQIQISIYADADAEVMINTESAEIVGDWWYRRAEFWGTVNLDAGSNEIVVTINSGETELSIIREPTFEHVYGRVLDTWTGGELGIDFGEMDFEPDYGQGDFFPGQIVVEAKQLDPKVVLIYQPERGWDWPLAIQGDGPVWDFFTYGDSRNHDVWNIILNGDTIVQIEGPIPLGE